MQATMCIFLSVQMLDKVVAELIEGGYDKTTPVAIVVKLLGRPAYYSWHGKTIADIVAKEGVLRQAMIVVSHVLDSEYELSKTL